MKLNSPAVISDVFELVKTIEFDMEIGGKFLPTRVEVFRDTQKRHRFRCHLWECDYYHMQSTFGIPSGGKKGSREETDEPIMVERSWELSSKFHDFEAADADEALRKFLKALQDRVAQEMNEMKAGQ